MTTTSMRESTCPLREDSVLHRWASVVRASPDRPAFSSPGKSVTFSEADRGSDRVARAVLTAAEGVAGPVGLLVEQSAEGLVALIGVLKTGRLVVPLDPQLPVARLQQIAARVDLSVCLTDATHIATAHLIGSRGAAVLDVEEILAGVDPESPDQPLDVPGGRGSDGAVIVFTSGSTGHPKGVVLTHDLMLSSAAAARERFGIASGDRVALVLPLAFTAGLLVVAVALCNGAGVWAYDPRRRGVRDLIAWVEEQRLTTLHCTPHLLRSIVDALHPQQVLSSVRLVTTAGEAVFGKDVLAVRPHLPAHASFFNWSGSSEIGSLASFAVRGGDPVPAGALPAGLPEADKEVRVLRPDGSAADVGEPAEVVVVSRHLSAGYWEDQERTSARFGEEADGRRSYRTGDLGRLDVDGNLHLLGRMDDAVKVRGYLVEPAEVQAALLSSPAITEAVVVPVVDPPSTTRLVAYVSPNPGMLSESPATIRRRLRAALPEYMVPSAIVQLPLLPRSERGKVDRDALPPAAVRSCSRPPATREEAAVADLWSLVLGLDPIGADDDFMQLGGDSLAVEEMLTLTEERFNVSLVSGDLLQAPTLAEFTRRVVSGAAALPTHPTAVTLRSAGAKKALFCFAGAGALGMSFLPLARHLQDRPVHAFQAKGLEGRAVPDWSVHRAARRHLQVMRVLQPRGPYILVGHSFGGLLALEVAHQLRAAGEEVALLALLDTYLPLAMRPREVSAPERTAHPLLVAAGAARRVLSVPARRLLPEGLPPLRQVPERLRIPLAGVVRFGMTRQAEVFFNQSQVVARRHRMQPYAGRVVAVLANGNPDGPTAWKPILVGSQDFHQFSCDHNSLLREPFVSELANLLERKLGEVAL
ncbi:alpha/beta fold hydrolase [Kineococcus sp. T13]|uniref:alpha/beta fold hydrolase n=1 Tax=Kineococcus vitellinus TaxID=2696565 RepID=UPI001413508E|nr:non-ribosomal peptide synthetase [Kineococcus vitellinus]NAZ74091.1 alpha/beta fold hydrolase [Kineococcus vitellinus]